MQLKGKHVLITGGSSGIGEACAVLCVKQGAKVTLVARRAAELQAAQSRVATAASDAGASTRLTRAHATP
jgi:NAD(P)-dependent dehydrogenase (short-subunit alcohol dehydrogenase family)